MGTARSAASIASDMTTFDIDAIRARFPALSLTHEGRPMAFFDGPGGTQVPDSVIDAVSRYYREANANHGGAFATSERSDAIVEDAHAALADLLGVDADEAVEIARAFAIRTGTALVLLGASDMISVIIRATLTLLATPDEMRGRVTAVDMIFIGTSNEFGQFESGLTAHWFGTVPAVVLGGVGTLLIVTLWALWFPDLRRAGELHSITTDAQSTTADPA